MADPMTRVTVWYDGACPLCIREIALMRRLDKRRAIDFVDVAPSNAVCPIDRTLLLARFHAQETGGPIISGAAAFAAMWRAIPILRPVGLIARNGSVLALLERAYLAFLKIRPRMQKLAAR
jgi:predicted DCC family thiol-disulfide oxidoreductase YuxK